MTKFFKFSPEGDALRRLNTTNGETFYKEKFLEACDEIIALKQQNQWLLNKVAEYERLTNKARGMAHGVERLMEDIGVNVITVEKIDD